MSKVQTPVYSKESLLAMFSAKVVTRPVEGLGEIKFRELSVPEVSEIRGQCKDADKKADFGFLLVIASVVDDQGNPMFTPADLPALKVGAQSRIDGVVSAVMQINGFVVDAKAAEDTVKN